jgi:hypothetical protein
LQIDLFKSNHIIADAVVETVYTQVSEPTRQFTGITVHDGFDAYVTVIDPATVPIFTRIQFHL